jgi:hypothetical protein
MFCLAALNVLLLASDAPAARPEVASSTLDTLVFLSETERLMA